MKILLTGSNGFIGTHFRKTSGYKDIVCWDRKIGKDVRDIRIRDLKGIDVIIHLAADISGEESWRRPIKYLRNNTFNTLNLALRASKAGVKRFVFASSAAVYGINSINPYGISKLCAEEGLSSLKDKIDIVILRFFNIYGSGQNKEYSGVITKFFNSIRSGKDFTVYNAGKSIRDYIYIEDVIKAIKKSLVIKKFDKPIDVGTGKGTSTLQLGNLFLKLFAKSDNFFINYEHKKEILKSIARVDRSFLDWKLTDLETGLKKLNRKYDK